MSGDDGAMERFLGAGKNDYGKFYYFNKTDQKKSQKEAKQKDFLGEHWFKEDMNTRQIYIIA